MSPVYKRKVAGVLRWRYDKTVRGRRLLSGAIYLSKTEAEQAEAEVLAHYQMTGEVLGPPTMDESQEKVSTLLARWVRWLRLHRSSNHTAKVESLFGRAVAIGPEYAAMPADDLRESHVESWGERWAADLLDRGRGLQTINDFLRHGMTAFNEPWGRRRARKLRPYNPFEYVDRYSIKKRAKFVPPPQTVNALRLAAEGEFRLYLEILCETAARVGEGRALAWESVDCDSEHPTVVLYTRKTALGDSLPRRLKISDNLADRFRSWRRQQAEKKKGAVYVFEQDDQHAPRVDIWIRKQLTKACERAGVDYFPPGCLRHYRASLWVSEGKDPLKVQRWLGHTTFGTTDRYLHQLTGV